MALRLSQKERMLLEDLKSQEDICRKKYSAFAQQANDTELKNMLSSIAVDEQQHYDTINTMLQGQEPSITKQQTPEQQQAEKQQAQQQISQMEQGMQQSAGFGSMGTNPDKDLLGDLLSTEKYVSSTYDLCVFEAASPVIRQAFQHIQKEEQHHGEMIFNYMHSHGMYPVN